MKLDASLTQPHGHDIDRFDAPSLFELAGSLESRGYDALWMPEAAHDPFVALAIATAATSSVQVGTGIAVALARNPMTLAYLANDLQLLSRGRFVLGLGSQVQQHIERRFSEEWSKPVARMREMIVTLRAIWASWNDGSRLNLRGEFWSHTLMPPFFSPGPNPYGPPPIHLAGVSERMTELAGELCEGFCAHSFTSPEYLQSITWPALRRGRASAADELTDPEVSLPLLLATGSTEEEFRVARLAVAEAIGFYASTPSYRAVLAVHGWEAVHDETSRLAREGRWPELPEVIDDSVLATFALVAEPADVGRVLAARYGDMVQRVSFATPYAMSAITLDAVVASVHEHNKETISR